MSEQKVLIIAAQWLDWVEELAEEAAYLLRRMEEKYPSPSHYEESLMNGLRGQLEAFKAVLDAVERYQLNKEE